MASQPKWMKERIKQVAHLRERGWDSTKLSMMTETDVKKAYDDSISHSGMPSRKC